MNKITVDFNKVTGEIKPMHGVGQPPIKGNDYSMIEYLKEAKIPYSRLHDVGGPFGGNRFVDIPNLFRDFDADPYDPESYDFAFTDLLITALIERGVEPFFRLGVTIENYASVKAYRVFPPKDNLKWAQICEGIIRHYTEGWANGFKYDIKYWEIWNEPEGKEMWMGTQEQFFALYNVASKYLKEKFPHLKIGGYASCGFYAITKDANAEHAAIEPRFEYYLQYFNDFLKFIKENKCPLDFFSWHSYDHIEKNILYASYARKRLDEEGYVDTECTLNEWNDGAEKIGTAEHAAYTCGMMLALQNTSLDSAMFYDARCGCGSCLYSSMFNPITCEPYPAYYSFVAFSELYRRKNQVATIMEIPGVYACAAKDETGCVVIVNTNAEEVELSIAVTDGYDAEKCMQIVDDHIWEEVSVPEKLPGYSVNCIYYKNE